MCEAVGLARATYCRNLVSETRQPETRAAQRQPPARSLSVEKRKTVLDQLGVGAIHRPDPSSDLGQITRLDEGRYFGSVSTMDRVLRAACGIRKRRDQLRHPLHATPIPELFLSHSFRQLLPSFWIAKNTQILRVGKPEWKLGASRTDSIFRLLTTSIEILYAQHEDNISKPAHRLVRHIPRH
jgi:hypothetical protein